MVVLPDEHDGRSCRRRGGAADIAGGDLDLDVRDLAAVRDDQARVVPEALDDQPA